MADNCKLIQPLQAGSEALGNSSSCADISPHSKKLFLSAVGEEAFIWTVGKLDPLIALKGHKSEITGVGFHPNETYVGGGAKDGSLKIWDLQQGGKVARTLAGDEEEAIRSVVFHPFAQGADIVVTASASNTISVWNFRQRECLKRLDAQQLPASVAAAYQGGAAAPAKTEASLRARRIALNAMKERADGKLHTEESPAVTFSPNGRWLLYASGFGASEQQTAKELHELTDSAASTESMCKLMYSYVHVWDMGTGEAIAGLKHDSREGRVTSINFHPHELILVTSTAAGVVRVWDLEKNFALVAEMRCQHSEANLAMDLNATGAHSLKSASMFSADGASLLCLYSEAGQKSWLDRFSFSSRNLARNGCIAVGWTNAVLAATLSAASIITLEKTESTPRLWLVNSSFAVQQKTMAAPKVEKAVTVTPKATVKAEKSVQKPTSPARVVKEAPVTSVAAAAPVAEKAVTPVTVAVKEVAPSSEVSVTQTPEPKKPTTKETKQQTPEPMKPAEKKAKLQTPEPKEKAPEPKKQTPEATKAVANAKRKTPETAAAKTSPDAKPLAVATRKKTPEVTKSLAEAAPRRSTRVTAKKAAKENLNGNQQKAASKKQAGGASKKRTLVASERKTADEPLCFADFAKGLNVEPLAAKTASEITSDLFSGSAHSKFCSTLANRLGAVKTLAGYRKREEWGGVVDTISKCKDHALLYNCFDSVLGFGQPVLKGKHLVYQAAECPFQPEQTRNIMPLIQQLVSSKNQEHVVMGMLMTQRMTLSFSKATIKSSLCFQWFNIVIRQVEKLKKISTGERRTQQLARTVSATFRECVA